MMPTALLAGSLLALVQTGSVPDTETIGSGSIYTSLPDTVSGPADTDGAAVTPRLSASWSGPAPTNTWWSSLIWERSPGDDFGLPMHAHPLSMRAHANGLNLGHVAQASATGVGYQYLLTDATTALSIGMNGLSADEIQVDTAGDWTVTPRWQDAQRTLWITIGRGLPNVVARTSGGSPQVTAAMTATVVDSGDGYRILAIQNQLWGLFADAGTVWTQQGDVFEAAGAQRIAVAILPDSTPATIDRFRERSLIRVTDTRVSWQWQPQSGTMAVTYELQTQQSDGVEPLVCLYGHQVAHTNQDHSNQDWGDYDTARGPMKLVATTNFTLDLPVAPLLGLLPDTGVIDRQSLRAALENDLTSDTFPSDTYWCGKALGRHGQLALIADQLGETEARDLLIDRMKLKLQTWFSATVDEGPIASGRLQAESATASEGVAIEDVEGADGQAVTGFGDGDWIQLSEVEFSDATPVRMIARYASGTSSSGMMRVRVDSIDGPIVAEAALGSTGGWTVWTDIPLGLMNDDELHDTHDLFLQCDTNSSEDIFWVDWITFDYGGGDDGLTSQFFAHDPMWSTLIGYPASYGADTELNDHHFHYGYFINAAAIIARFDPAWAQTDAWGGMVELLIKDAANWDRTDERFCFLRHLEPYVGYSYASGHAGFWAGNNQESSSEALNFASACVLWGETTANEDIRDLGLFLLSLESIAVEQYWFDVDQTVFPEAMPHPVAGIVWDSGADYATWWTANPEEIHGINMLPMSGGSLYLGRRVDNIERNWNHLIEQNGGQPTVWQDVLWSFLALADANGALELMHTNQDEGGYTPEPGDSRTRTQHWLQALTGLGQLDPTTTANTPLAAVFTKDGVRTWVAHNLQSTDIEVRFSDGATFCVPAGELLWSHTNQDGVCPSNADLDGDGLVGVNDLLILLAAWGPCPDCNADLNGNGTVEVDDLLALLQAWN